jgi:uncharacterized protein (DUF1330 family)
MKENAMADVDKRTLTPGIISKEAPRTFTEWVNKINASPAFFEALSRQPDTGPVIMLNFVRYRPRGDGSRYGLYGAAAVPAVLSTGADYILHGEGITDAPKIFQMSDEWDGVIYVLYPRRSSYLQTQQDVNYQLAIPDRVAGTSERMLYVLSDGDAIYEATGSIATFHKTHTPVAIEAGNVVVSEFLRFKKPDGRKEYEKFAAGFAPMLKKIGGEVVLSARAEMPCVSEEYWDHFVSLRFPSLAAMQQLYRSDTFQEINVHRLNGLDGTLAVLSKPAPLPPKPIR